jgi:hypothetical protein
MNMRIGSTQILAIAGLTLIFGQSFAGQQTVNCDEGESLQHAIDSGAGSAAEKEIYVTGHCEENLRILRDKITLIGVGNTVIDGRILVRGSDNITLESLTITGPRDGISASMSRIFMDNVDVVGNGGYGIALRHGGAIFLRDGSIADNLGGIGLLIENGHGDLRNIDVFSNAVDGIVVNVNGNLTMIGGSVNLHDQGTGITANLSSSVELEEVSVSNNLAGMSVSMGAAAVINNSTINENADVGIVVKSGALGLNNVEISGNRAGITASMAKINLESVHVVNNAERGIDVAASSGLIFYGGSVSGNGDAGVIVENGSSLAAEGVSVRENGSTGIRVSWNSNADIVACAIHDNAQVIPNRSGVFVRTSSSATIDSTEVFGNGTGIGVTRQSFVDLTGNTVVRDNSRHGMGLSYDSGAIVNDPVFVPENGSGFAVYCRDTESSFENRSPGVGLTNCKGFDLP